MDARLKGSREKKDNSDEAFNKRRMDWERRIEDIIIEMVSEKTVNDLSFMSDPTPVIKAFNDYISTLSTFRKTKNHYLTIETD